MASSSTSADTKAHRPQKRHALQNAAYEEQRVLQWEQKQQQNQMRQQQRQARRVNPGAGTYQFDDGWDGDNTATNMTDSQPSTPKHHQCCYEQAHTVRVHQQGVQWVPLGS